MKLTANQIQALVNARDHGTPNYDELGRAFGKRWNKMVDALEKDGLLARVFGKATRQITAAGQAALHELGK